eukprot:1141405-Pelagomonas_calceolata.AAC.1
MREERLWGGGLCRERALSSRFFLFFLGLWLSICVFGLLGMLGWVRGMEGVLFWLVDAKYTRQISSDVGGISKRDVESVPRLWVHIGGEGQCVGLSCA